MKKSFSVNIGGRIFQIDEDAYQLLADYLRDIKSYFSSKSGSEEIVEDIESRLSELCEERMEPGCERIVTLSMIESFINRVGKPESIGMDEQQDDKRGEEQKENEKKSSEWNFEQWQTSHGQKKLYRDSQDRMLGGVISGLAAYFGCNVTLLRVLTIIFALMLNIWFVVVYIVLWIVMPEARTAAQRLRMEGCNPTVENIGEKVTAEFKETKKIWENNSGDDSTNKLLKICIIVMAIVLLVPLVSITGSFVFFPFMMGGAPIFFGKISGIAAFWFFIISIIPLFALFHLMMVKMFNWKPLNVVIKSLLIISWIISIFLFCVTC